MWMLLFAACNLPDPFEEEDAAATTPQIKPKVWETLIHKKELLTQPYHIDGIYPSMTGPSGFNHASLLVDGKPELLWITGYKTTVIDVESGKYLGQEYMCHANLDLDAKKYYTHFPKAPPISGRLFTLSQGQEEAHFPAGMGIPVRSDLELSLATQVLNLNRSEIDLNVQYKVEVEYVRDKELDPYRSTHPNWDVTPLYQTAVQGFKALENARYYGVAHKDVDEDELGEGCGVGMSAIDGDVDEDAYGQKFTAHWVVNPGREVNRTNVTKFLNLPYDTRAFYIATHLHPFAESLTLTDLTTGQQVYQSTVRNSTDRIGIDEVDVYSSHEGIELIKDHEYELTSVYNNRSKQNVDSMAVLYMYALDANFNRERSLQEIATAAREPTAAPKPPTTSM